VTDDPTAARLTVGVFAGSAPDSDPAHRPAAARLGELLAQAGVAVVYGGGRLGMMGAFADGVLAAGGDVLGVVPRGLFRPGEIHPRITLVEAESLHERKLELLRRADAFVALPGGFGTLDEVGEVLTWSQIGIHHKPIVLLDLDGSWRALADWIEQAVAHGYVPESSRAMVTLVGRPEDVLPAVRAYRPPPALHALDPDQA